MAVCISIGGYSQGTVNELVSVRAIISGPHAPAFKRNNNDTGYSSTAVVRNNQDTSICFWIMSQSWTVDNWITDSDSILIYFEGNSLQSTDKIKLLPHQEIIFSLELIASKTNNINRSFKLGLIFSEENDWMSHQEKQFERRRSGKIYWSNRIELENIFNKYKLIEY